MDCPSCQHENSERASFCESCGSRLALICANCGGDLSSQARFCSSCGAAVTVDGANEQARAVADYTPKHLAEKILQSRSALEGEHKQVTVLFADVKGSMEIAGSVDAETWHRILDDFFAILSEGVHRFEGTINQYTGDGIMALFGAPIAHEDHAQRACYAALRLRDRLREYGDRMRIEHGVSFGVRLGINSGDVVVGKIGDDLRMDYTAQGQTVGVAQRIEQLAEAGHAYLGEATERLVRGYFLLRGLGGSKLKGADKTVEIFELEDVSSAKSRLDVSRSRGLTRFVGRADEMSSLDHALARAQEGHGQVVGVVGEPGLGKSRLCFEFVERCRAQGIPVAEAHCPAHGANVPYLPILELYRDYLGIAATDGPAEARQKIAGALLLLDPDLHETLPVLFDFMGVADPARPAPSMDARTRQRQLFALTRRVTHARDEQGITNVVMIDDLHWIDPGSDLFVAQMVEAAENSRMMLLLNFRPEYGADWTHKAHYQQLPLVPLGRDDVRELVEALIGTDGSVAPLAERILEWTAGNPFFAEEVIQMLVETDALEGRPGAYRLVREIDRIEVPANVRAVLAARIDRLAEAPKRVLQRAAVIGKYFPAPVVEAIVDVSPDELSAALETLKRSEFIYEDSLYPVVEYAFKHPLSHEVAYDSLLGDRRKSIHEAVAVALEAHHRDRIEEQASLLAYHWDAAEQADRAIIWHRRAAQWSGINDAPASLRHWHRVRQLVGQIPENTDALSLGAQACSEILMTGRLMPETVAEAGHYFAQGVDFAERCGDMERLAILNGTYGASRAHAGSADDYLVYARKAMEIVTTTDNPALLAAVRMMSGHAHFIVGKIREGYEIAKEVCSSTPGDPRYGAEYCGYSPRIGAFVGRGWSAVLLGRFDEAMQSFAEATRLLNIERYGEFPFWISTFSAKAAALTGVCENATEKSARSFDLAERMGSDFAYAAAYYELAIFHVVEREWARAGDALERFLSMEGSGHAAGIFRASVLAHYAEVLLETGKLDRAHEKANEAVAYSLASGFRWDAEPWLASARVSMAREERDQARIALADFESLIEDTGARAFLPFLHEARSEFATLFDSDWSQEGELQEAKRLFDELGSIGHAARLAEKMADP